jgi:GIY-YIG catalytic domain
MCGEYRVNMKYKPGFARYDIELYDSLSAFLETSELAEWECSEAESYVNICATNKKRNEINAACLARWVAEHRATLIKFCFPVCVGLPVMAYNDADKQLKIYKTQVWTIKRIEKDQIFLERDGETVYLSKTEFGKIFEYAFAMTVHKCQSITIHDHFNIYESKQMTKDVMYTALSRATKKSNVHVVEKRGWKYPINRRMTSIEINLEPIKLKTGRIYRIRLSNGCEYIGKTVKTLEERLAEHKASPTNEQMKAALDESATIELVQEFKYRDERQLLSAEESCIAQALERGARLLNDKHNKPAAAAAQTPAKVAAAPKINIREDSSKHRYEIQVRSSKIQKDDQVRRFAFGSDKVAAMAEAEAWRTHLIHKYF